jgi:hypothetical protein
MEPEEDLPTTTVRYTSTPYKITPYKAIDGLPSEDLYKAEEIRIAIAGAPSQYRSHTAPSTNTLQIELMHKEIAEQLGAGLTHPYASGIFSVTHHDDGSTYTAQLNFHPSLANDSHGRAAESKILRKGESKSEIVRAMIRLLCALDPSGMVYRNLSWIKGVKEAERSLRFDALS